MTVGKTSGVVGATLYIVPVRSMLKKFVSVMYETVFTYTVEMSDIMAVSVELGL